MTEAPALPPPARSDAPVGSAWHKMWLFIAILLFVQAPTSSESAAEQKKALNPETLMNVSQIVCHRGYPSEEYEVLTRDGYYIRLNRIPHGREKPNSRGAKPVVFLQHGIFGEGSHWVENLANNSLGFILADSGYDVWLGNSRGTSWSRRHQHLSADQVEFWDFSFHEMAMYDLPAAIDFVLQKTGQKQLHYVGYSQGCTIAFIAFSSMPELAQKVKMFFALAPVVTAKHARSPLMKLLFLLDKSLKMIPLLLGRTDASLHMRKLWRFLPELCRHTLLHRPCANLLFLLGGHNEKNLNMVGVPCRWGRGSQGRWLCHPPCPASAAATGPQCSQHADPARATRVPPPAASPPGTGKAPRLCRVVSVARWALITPLSWGCLSLRPPRVQPLL
uniref:Uncharacterized protein n=1 Tax=Corvus moneduloides TaxID=1196302 RepID=A0A8U7MXJ7_CORMO